MNKRSLLIILLGFIGFSLFADEVLISSFALYDANGSKFEKLDKPHKKIYSKLQDYWFEGLFNFGLVPEKEYGEVYTSLDANKVCAIKKCDYLIYGFVQKNENHWFGNIKLFDSENKKVIKEFFASDELDCYDRFLETLSCNVVDGLKELCGLNTIERNKISYRDLEIRIPAALYYWNPIDSEWKNVVTGIVGVKGGIEIYPPQQLQVLRSKVMDFSGVLHLNYSYGMGKTNVYPLNLNTIQISLPSVAHIHLNSEQSIYLGAGLYYELEFLEVREKYKDTENYIQNIFGLETIIGYEMKITDLINIFSDFTFNFHYNDKFVSIKPTVGASFNIFKGEFK